MKYKQIDGWWEDEALFRDIVKDAPDPAHFVEVGSWMGRSAACMAEIIKDSGKLIRFDQVDTWQGSPYGSHPEKVAALEADGKTLRQEFERNLRAAGLWEYVNPVEGDSIEVADRYEPWSLDCVFIDADHRVDKVENDLRAWMPKLKPGGILCGHDWPVRQDSPQGVKDAIDRVGLHQVEHRGMVWWVRKANLHPLPYHRFEVRYPPKFPGVQRAWWYLRHGFTELGCKVEDDPALLALGHWSPPARLPDPVHVAVLRVMGRTVHYDVSDFAPSHPELGVPYFAKNALASDCPPVQPIGQYPGSEPQLLLDSLPQLRRRRPEIRVLAVYSNIDERLAAKANQYHEAAEKVRRPRFLRRGVVDALRGEDNVVTGLWRWSILRPEVDEDYERERVPLMHHWRRISSSRCVVCLPGVGGDSTRLRTETLSIGSAVVTVRGDQAWPGNWQGCWLEAERDAESVAAAALRLSDDPTECERYGRLGKWYFETALRPERMAERVVRACV